MHYLRQQNASPDRHQFFSQGIAEIYQGFKRILAGGFLGDRASDEGVRYAIDLLI
jgi:hypothetical protein